MLRHTEHIHRDRAARARRVEKQGTADLRQSDPYNRACFTEEHRLHVPRRSSSRYVGLLRDEGNGRAVEYNLLEPPRTCFGGIREPELTALKKPGIQSVFIGSEMGQQAETRANAQEMARFGDGGWRVHGGIHLDPDNKGDYANAITEQYWSSLVFRNFLGVVLDYEGRTRGRRRFHTGRSVGFRPTGHFHGCVPS